MPSFNPQSTVPFSLKEVEVHDLVPDPAEHFHNTSDIIVHIGDIRARMHRRYVPYAIEIPNHEIVLHGELQIGFADIDNRPDVILPYLLDCSELLARKIIELCFERHRKQMLRVFSQIPAAEWEKKFT